MKTITRFLLTLILLTGALRAQTWETFELRAAAPFAARSVNIDDGNGSQGPGAFELVVDGSVSPPQGYARLSGVSLDSSAAAQWWTFEANGWTASVDAAGLQSARDNGYVLWIPFSPPENAPIEVLVPAGPSGRTGNSLALVQRDGAGPYVLTTLSLNEVVNDGWTRASASFNPALPFWVEDLTANERTPDGETLLQTWTPDSEAYPLEGVSFVLDGAESGMRFTVHYINPNSGQPEMVQSIDAVPNPASGPQTMGDGATVDVTGTAIVTGSVAVGSTYWLTRDSDGWSTAGAGLSWSLGLFESRPDPLQWSLVGLMPGVPVPWQTVTFHIASGYWGGAWVEQPSGTRGLAQVGSGVVQDFDSNGNPNDFYYDEVTAEIDPAEDFWLMVNGTQLSVGVTEYTNGWQFIGGTPGGGGGSGGGGAPGENWQTVTFQIALGYGSTASLFQAETNIPLTDTYATGTIVDYDTSGQDHSFTYEVWSAWMDVNKSFTLYANWNPLPAGETWFYNGWEAIGGTSANWANVEFEIATGFGATAVVRQNGSDTGLNPIGLTGSIPDTDALGQDHTFHYERWTAWLDTTVPFQLIANGEWLPEGETRYYNGWTPIGGPATSLTLAVTVHASRANHSFTLSAPDGATWSFSITDWSGSQWVELSNPWEEGSWNLEIYTAGATQTFSHSGQAGTWTLRDDTENEVMATFDPAGQPSMSLDLATVYPPAETVPLQISLSRWGHDLRVRQRNGEEFSITPGASQGGATLSGAVAWYHSYYCFDATGYRRDVPGMDWWVVDLDTGETAPLNQTNLIDWIALMPPEQVVAARTSAEVVRLVWDIPSLNDPIGFAGGGFYIERMENNSGIWVRTVIDVASLSYGQNPGSFLWEDGDVIIGDSYQYRVAYFYGSPAKISEWVQSGEVTFPENHDWDHDGMSDAWEIANVLDPDDAADASGDADADGLSNLGEFLFGSDPRFPQPANGGGDAQTAKMLRGRFAVARASKPGEVAFDNSGTETTYLRATYEHKITWTPTEEYPYVSYENQNHEWTILPGAQWISSAVSSGEQGSRDPDGSTGGDLTWSNTWTQGYTYFATSPSANFYDFESYRTSDDNETNYFGRGAAPVFYSAHNERLAHQYGYGRYDRSWDGGSESVDVDLAQDGFWYGTATYHYGEDIETNAVNGPGGEPQWNPSPVFANLGYVPTENLTALSQGPLSVSWTTQEDYPDYGTSEIISVSATLSSPYTNAQFAADVAAALPVVRSDNSSDVADTLLGGVESERYSAENLHGQTLAWRNLTAESYPQKSFSEAAKCEYWFETQSGDDKPIIWAEVFYPDDPAQSSEIVKVLSWDPREVPECPHHTLDPSSRAENGSYRLVYPLDLAPDYNRDQAINAADKWEATAAKPYRFWINNDYDVDDSEGAGEPVSSVFGVEDSEDDVIRSNRDLEDFTRLDIYLGQLHEIVSAGNLNVGLRWKNTGTTSPGIKLWWNVSPNGNAQYLEDNIVASSFTALGMTPLGELSGTATFICPREVWENQWFGANDPKGHLLFEGMSEGKGQLMLVFFNAAGDEIGEAPGPWLELKNVRRMFQRGKAWPEHIEAPYESETGPYTGLMSYGPDDGSWPYEPDPDEEDKAVIFVHGWSMDYPNYMNFSETMFKRLWHEGFKGRFCAFRWNPLVANPYILYAGEYNRSEHRAFLYGESLKQFVNDVKAQGFSVSLIGHSMGNIVCSSALEKGLGVDNYILMEAAVPAGCYDTSGGLGEGGVNGEPRFWNAEAKHPTPDYHQSPGFGIIQGLSRLLSRNQGQRGTESGQFP